MFRLNVETAGVSPRASVSVTVATFAATTVGVPETTPVLVFSAIPVGIPVTDQRVVAVTARRR